MNTPDQLGRERIERLAADILLSIRTNYLAGPTSRDRVFESLNALAFATTIVIASTEDDSGEAARFFHLALDNQLMDLISKQP
jgi:hypothetical protein